MEHGLAAVPLAEAEALPLQQALLLEVRPLQYGVAIVLGIFLVLG
jgi:hypothetical protein